VPGAKNDQPGEEDGDATPDRGGLDPRCPAAEGRGDPEARYERSDLTTRVDEGSARRTCVDGKALGVEEQQRSVRADEEEQARTVESDHHSEVPVWGEQHPREGESAQDPTQRDGVSASDPIPQPAVEQIATEGRRVRDGQDR